MDWNGNVRVPFVSSRLPDHNSYTNYLYNYNNYNDHFPVLEMKQASMHGGAAQKMMNYNGVDPKKKRLSNEQLELLENSFQEDIKLDPDRKMKLAKELGLQPRQIAVWFQNRRARWKGKQLERLYDALKHQYDAVSRDKNKLQQEVMALRAILKDEVGKKQVSTAAAGGFTEISAGDQAETVESTSIPSCSGEKHDHLLHHHHQIAAECNYPAALNMDDYNNAAVMIPAPYWATN